MLDLPPSFRARQAPLLQRWATSVAALPVVFGIAFVIRNGIPGEVSSLPRWTFHLLAALVEGYLWWAILMSIHLNLSRWMRSVRIVGWPSRVTRQELRRLYWRSIRGGRSALVGRIWPLALFLALFFLYRWNGWLLFAALMLKGVIAEGFLRPLLPPSALLLSSSRPEAVELHARLLFDMRLLRVVSLLRPDGDSRRVMKVMTTFDCFRNTEDRQWHEAVLAWAELAPIIVLDGRFATPYVRQEAESVISRLAYKVIIVLGAQGQRPLLDSLMGGSLAASHRIPLVREADVPPLLGSLTASPGMLPSPERPLWDIVKNHPKCRTVSRIDASCGSSGTAARR